MGLVAALPGDSAPSKTGSSGSPFVCPADHVFIVVNTCESTEPAALVAQCLCIV